MEPNVGIDKDSRKQVVDGLSKFLADTFSVYLKTLNFHWNVTGNLFRDLHLTFEEQYTELFAAIDVIAERITILGYPAPGTYKEFSELSTVKDASGIPSAENMIKELLADNEVVIRNGRALTEVAAKVNDEATVGLLADRITVHEKAAWLLRSKLN